MWIKLLSYTTSSRLFLVEAPKVELHTNTSPVEMTTTQLGVCTLVCASLGRRFHIVGQRNVVRSSVRAFIVCRKSSAKPRPQLMGQLPLDRITPGIVFEKVGIDYAGPIYIKSGHVRRRTIVKAYICVSQGICWSFIPECAPHFVGLWESTVESVKIHLKRIVGDMKFTFEELTTILTD